MIRPNSQNARILRALSSGRWVTTSELHRRCGLVILHSRVSELRKQGYVIEHETVEGKSGSLGHKYRLLNAQLPAEIASFSDRTPVESLPRDEVPRDPEHRYRLYRMQYDEVDLVGTAPTAEEVGVAIVKLGLSRAFSGSCLGLLDSHGTESRSGTWVVLPWDTNP